MGEIPQSAGNGLTRFVIDLMTSCPHFNKVTVTSSDGSNRWQLPAVHLPNKALLPA